MQDDWRAYFTFTRRERTGFISLLVVIIVLGIWPYFFRDSSEELSMYPLGKTVDSTIEVKTETEEHRGHQGLRTRELFDEEKGSGRQYFYFDPNKLPDSGWAKLGISQRTIGTIRKYLSKGGKFRKPDDVGRIYGISKRQFQSILPFIRIDEGSQKKSIRQFAEKEVAAVPAVSAKGFTGVGSFSSRVIEINTADSLDWVRLPGIGPKLTSRILKFKNKLGGFYAVEQVAQIYGLTDSTFQKIKSQMTCEPSGISLMHLNSATERELRMHPYIGWKLAKLIVNFRSQHGNYKSVDDVRQIILMKDSIFTRLRPYLTVE